MSDFKQENREPINHDLKIHSLFFNDVISGFKTFEIRFDDRDFRANDTVTLHEMHQNEEEEPVKTGRICTATIGLVTSFFQRDGFVVFSLIGVKTGEDGIKPDIGETVPKEYICPQCGNDKNGGDIHQLTHHTWPPLSVDEATSQIQTKNKEFIIELIKSL